MDRGTRSLAKKLVTLSLENGQVSSEKVSAVLQVLKAKPPRNYKQVLETYLNKLSVELRRENATIAVAGNVSEETIKSIQQGLNDYYKRDLNVAIKESPELIAGVRIHVADDVWDASVAGRLQSFSHNL